MEAQSVNNILAKLLDSHEVDFAEENGWLLPYAKLPAVRATWYDSEERRSGLLRIEVYIEADQILEECFAGMPTQEGKLNDAFGNFVTNSFHVLLSAFWNKHAPEQVEKEHWSINGSSYTAFIGPYGIRGAEGTQRIIPKETFETIEKSIRSSVLSEDCHWFRIFFCNIGNGEMVFEALQNNEMWEAGISALKALDWQEKDQYYSFRNFIVLLKGNN